VRRPASLVVASAVKTAPVFRGIT